MITQQIRNREIMHTSLVPRPHPHPLPQLFSIAREKWEATFKKPGGPGNDVSATLQLDTSKITYYHNNVKCLELRKTMTK